MAGFITTYLNVTVGQKFASFHALDLLFVKELVAQLKT